MIAVIGKNVPWPAAAVPRMRTGGGRGRGAGERQSLEGTANVPILKKRRQELGLPRGATPSGRAALG